MLVKKSGGRTNAGRKAYQAMMQEKRIVGALQAEQNAKAQAAKAELIAKNEDRAPIDIARVNQIMQAESAREKLIAKNEDRAPINEVKVQQLVQQSVEANRWAGGVSVAQAKQEAEENQSWWQKAWESTKTFV